MLEAHNAGLLQIIATMDNYAVVVCEKCHSGESHRFSSVIKDIERAAR